MPTFASMLTGGHPNSLGRTEEVVSIVVADRDRLDELFATMADPDDVVRMRAGDALEKTCRERPHWFLPHVERILDDVAAIDQPSVQWHVAQILDHLRADLTEDQARRALRVLRRNLTRSRDWIVLNVTMDVLATWSTGRPAQVRWLIPRLQRLRLDPRTSVARRASQRLIELTK